MRFVCSLRLSKPYRPRPSCRHWLGLLVQNHQLIAAQRQPRVGVHHSCTIIHPRLIVGVSFSVASVEAPAIKVINIKGVPGTKHLFTLSPKMTFFNYGGIQGDRLGAQKFRIINFERKPGANNSPYNFMLERAGLQNLALLLGGALAQKLVNIKVPEVSVMEDNRFDRALHLVAFMTVCGDDVHDFAGNAVLVGQPDAAERMSHLLAKRALNHLA